MNRTAHERRTHSETVMPADVRTISLMVLAALAVVLMLKYAQAVLIPLVIGVLISYALEPPVAKLVGWRIPRALAAAIVLFVVVGAGGAMLYQLRGQVTATVEQLPEAARKLRHTIERPAAPTAIEQVQKAATELEKAAAAAAPAPPQPGVTRVQIESPTINIRDYLLWGSVSVVTAAMQGILTVLLTFFLLSSGDLFRRKLMKMAGPSNRAMTVQIFQEINRQIEHFLLVLLVTSAVVGVATWVAFRGIGLEQAAVWGLMAGIFNSIPYFGPVIVTGSTAVVAFLQFGTLHMAMITGGAALLITTLEGWLLMPWLSGRAVQMNAVAVFVGLLFWGWVWGVWGILLAVPMLVVMKAICDRVDRLRVIGELLGE